MADFGQLHVVECFEKLKGEDFSGDGIEGYFFLSLLFCPQHSVYPFTPPLNLLLH